MPSWSSPAPPSAADAAHIDQAYGELAKILSGWLGDTVRYEKPNNYMGYAQAMREGRYDLLVDGPHFAAWRMTKLQHQPVVESSERLVFLTLANADDDRIKSPDDLVNKRVCSQSSPSLATMMFLAQFPNPMRQPMMKYENGYAPNVALLKQRSCDAAVVNASFYDNQMGAADKAVVKVIHNTRPLPGVVVTAGPRLTPVQIDTLRSRLAKPAAEDNAAVLLLSKAALRGVRHEDVRWVPVKASELKGLDELLTSMSWGW